MNNQDYSKKPENGLDFRGDSSVNDSDMSDIRLLTLDEACRYLKVSVWSLYQLINKKALPTVKIGGRRLVRYVTLRDYIAKQEKGEAYGQTY
jgi:excisionase family DNA binding protein